jgi:hypothetical protein
MAHSAHLEFTQVSPDAQSVDVVQASTQRSFSQYQSCSVHTQLVSYSVQYEVMPASQLALYVAQLAGGVGQQSVGVRHSTLKHSRRVGTIGKSVTLHTWRTHASPAAQS